MLKLTNSAAKDQKEEMTDTWLGDLDYANGPQVLYSTESLHKAPALPSPSHEARIPMVQAIHKPNKLPISHFEVYLRYKYDTLARVRIWDNIILVISEPLQCRLVRSQPPPGKTSPRPLPEVMARTPAGSSCSELQGNFTYVGVLPHRALWRSVERYLGI